MESCFDGTEWRAEFLQGRVESENDCSSDVLLIPVGRNDAGECFGACFGSQCTGAFAREPGCSAIKFDEQKAWANLKANV
jgi:hypothetical protein